MLYATDGDYNFVQVPLVVWPRTISPNAPRKMTPKAINPKTNSFSTDNHTTLCQQILDVSRAQCKAMIGPDRIGDDFTRIAKAFQARHIHRNFYQPQIDQSDRPNNLAIPKALIKTGEVGDALLACHAELEPDILAFGRTQKIGLKSLIPGSTASLLLGHAACDVLIAGQVNE